MKIVNKGVVLDGGMYYYWDGSNDGMMAKVMMRDMMMPNTMFMIMLLAMYE